ncbi:hypothetical protein B0T25DRAFT_236864 [Lasiosphaeria hispida]|uniref:Heterokaryon incompatibility domain-containing protein n=1 Tax=Lasiosphaeria hispida TaxID=260671 RepID=A0AAJ0HEN5_9PEZI|nr:hypothetical protein B0T25DRAFT_236864 [Lasiosphaeria hispida]
MDHCLIPPGTGHIKVRNFTSNAYVSGPTGFLGHPGRQGWSSDDLNSRDFAKTRSAEQVRDFFQGWLFFGCAIEFLSLCGITAKNSDFTTEDGRYVTTQRLPQMLREWTEVAKKKPKSSRFSCATVIRASVILGTVRDYVDDHCLPRHGSLGMPTHVRARLVAKSPLPQRVWMSVIALGHALNKAMVSGFDIRRTGSHWGGSFMLQQRILAKGWCPVDVQRTFVTSKGLSIPGQYYMAKLHNTETNIHHGDCTEFECRARNTDESTYQQSHALGCKGDCAGFQYAPLEQLTTIIREGDIPVFKWNLGTRSLELAAVKVQKRGVGSPPFMAISHVWSDGLGNARDNAVYECQLEALQTGIDLAATKHKMVHGIPSHFWIDTLCVPVQKENKELRKKCIQDMKRIYESSCAVYVLSSLRNTSTTDKGPAGRIAAHFNNWDRRLWTYQECILGRKRLVQYADKTVDHVSIEADFYRDNLWSKASSGSPASPLPPLSGNIASRSTSRKSDEMLCVAPLLHLDLKPFLEAEKRMRVERALAGGGGDAGEISDGDLADERMKIFWQTIRACQWAGVFNPNRRLAADGFRWAPATFLDSPPSGFVKRVDQGYCKLDREGRGLRFTGQGIVIDTPLTWRPASSGALTVATTDPKIGRVSIEVTPNDLSFPTETFKWSPGTKYVIILATSLSVPPPGIRTITRMPKSGPDIELWLENVFKPGRVNMLTLDAVVATVTNASLHGRCQIRHECIAVAKVVESPLLGKSEAEKFAKWDKLARALLKTTLEEGIRPDLEKASDDSNDGESDNDGSSLSASESDSDEESDDDDDDDDDDESDNDDESDDDDESDNDGSNLSTSESGSDDGPAEETSYYDSYQPSEADDEDDAAYHLQRKAKLLEIAHEVEDSGSESADEGCSNFTVGKDGVEADASELRIEGTLTLTSAKWFIL